MIAGGLLMLPKLQLTDDPMPTPIDLVFLTLACFIIAALYSSVGHGGASGYLAAMGFAGVAPAIMKPSALVLNIVVSGLALLLFCRAGHWKGKLFWSLAATSVPAAFLGGWMHVSGPVFKSILACALGFAAWQLMFLKRGDEPEARTLPPPGSAVLGGVLGFLSGLVGIGGGVFLTPMLVLCRWAGTKTAAAVSAAFILVNSAAGLAGFFVRGGAVPELAFGLLPAVLAGGLAGSFWGSRLAPPVFLRRCLAVVLATAAIKFVVV
jgi:uncharacterized membrane protein YfcA